jgi:4-alpha-glucanotransferase
VSPPPRAYLPTALEAGRAWGFTVNLYALRSGRNWGIGDFGDLRAFVRYAASLGADVVGINPLHALHYADPESASPYAPTSRYFLNPLYIDVAQTPEYCAHVPAAAALRARVVSPPLAETLAALRTVPQIAYARVARLKWSALEACYEIFRAMPGSRRDAFRAFRERGGTRLERFALYQALGERFACEPSPAHGWTQWPPAFRDLYGASVQDFAIKARRRIDYFKYLQWLASEQLAQAAAEATTLGLGLYVDVAVGVAIDSADVWSDRSAYILDETIGAPPDTLGPHGQNWGLAPPDPRAMLRDAGAAFAEMLAANMAHAGALRLDHAMALLRLFRIPRGKTAAEGAYVAYPFEELLAVATRESERARCLIVGEDLGTVPDGFRERMERARVLSYRLLLFERETDGRFKAPSTYPVLALATATTHDLATLTGWALGCDLDARDSIRAMPAEDARHARELRRRDVSQLLEALRSHGELDGAAYETLGRLHDPGTAADASLYAPLVRAAYRYLAATPARLVLVQLDDALGEVTQINLPGTHGEYPNWRRKNALDLAAIMADPALAALARDVRERVKGGVAT